MRNDHAAERLALIMLALFFAGLVPVLSATADLEDADLEEVTLYAQFRKARHRARRRR